METKSPAELAALRMEIFSDEIESVVDFYTHVLRFVVVRDQRDGEWPYVAVQRGSIRLGIAFRDIRLEAASRRPPTGVELVLEVEDVVAERDRVAALWPLEEDLMPRSWGLTDFRVLDPAGYYLRLTQLDAPAGSPRREAGERPA